MREYVIVTGASSGIGYALALYFAEKNYHVVAIGRNEIALQRLVQTAKYRSKIITPIAADFRTGNYLDGLLAFLKQSRQQPTIKFLIHCAAVFEAGPLLTINRSTLHDIFEVNTLAPLMLTQALLSMYSERTRILFIGSDYFGTNKMKPNISGAYAASKTGLKTVVDYLRHENYPKLLMGYLNPGTTLTPLYTSFWAAVNANDSSGVTAANTIKPSTPDDVAQFIGLILENSSNEDFCKIEWDYRNQAHHEKAQTSKSNNLLRAKL